MNYETISIKWYSLLKKLTSIGYGICSEPGPVRKCIRMNQNIKNKKRKHKLDDIFMKKSRWMGRQNFFRTGRLKHFTTCTTVAFLISKHLIYWVAFERWFWPNFLLIKNFMIDVTNVTTQLPKGRCKENGHENKFCIYY